MLTLIAIAAWIALAFAFALALGRVIAFGSGEAPVRREGAPARGTRARGHAADLG